MSTQIYTGTNEHDGRLVHDSEDKSTYTAYSNLIKSFIPSRLLPRACANKCGNDRRDKSKFCQKCSDKYNKK